MLVYNTHCYIYTQILITKQLLNDHCIKNLLARRVFLQSRTYKQPLFIMET